MAKNENDYISIAVKLASDKKEMLDLRKKIFNNIPDSPLFDQKKFTSNFFDLIKNLDYFKT